MHRNQIPWTHPGARHLHEMIRLISTTIGYAPGSGRGGKDVRSREMIGSRQQTRSGGAGNVLRKVGVVITLRQGVVPIVVGGIALIVVSRSPATAGADKHEVSPIPWKSGHNLADGPFESGPAAGRNTALPCRNVNSEHPLLCWGRHDGTTMQDCQSQDGFGA